MISKTKISKRAAKKTNIELVETITAAKKNNPEIASLLSLPARKQVKKNLYEIDKDAKDKGTVIVPGKVLGKGELNKKIKIVALSYSSSALEKLNKKKIEASLLKKELKKEKKLEGDILR